jgi:hypothetical protein
MDLLGPYHFDDCLVLGLNVHPTLRTCEIMCEACSMDGNGPAEAKPQSLRIKLIECTSLHVTAKRELWIDLERSYDDGHTSKANEIISVELRRAESGECQLKLVSDMLTLGVMCSEAVLSVERH